MFKINRHIQNEIELMDNSKKSINDCSKISYNFRLYYKYFTHIASKIYIHGLIHYLSILND